MLRCGGETDAFANRIWDPQADRKTLLQLSRDPACLVADTLPPIRLLTLLSLSLSPFLLRRTRSLAGCKRKTISKGLISAILPSSSV